MEIARAPMVPKIMVSGMVL